MVLVLPAQLMISGKVTGKFKNYVGKTIRQKLGINSDLKTFWKKLRFHEIEIICSNSNITGIRYCLLNRAQKVQWEESIVIFTPAGSKVFWKSHSIANSHQKCVSRFLNEITFTVHMFNSPTTSCKTVKGSLQTPQSFKKYLWSMKWQQERWL